MSLLLNLEVHLQANVSKLLQEWNPDRQIHDQFDVTQSYNSSKVHKPVEFGVLTVITGKCFFGNGRLCSMEEKY
jgi:hypothetical protein